MATAKLTRPSLEAVESNNDFINSDYEFGALREISVDVSPSISLTFKEPTAEDFLKLQEFENSSNVSDVETTLFTICLLHVPDSGKKKISMREAKKLSARQLKKIGGALKILIDDEEEQDFKS